jgi:hypothetical protein
MEKMPLDTLAEWTLQDPSETIDDGEGISGWDGGELDVTSGVLTLTYTPHSEDDAPDVVQQFEATTARFVEIEKLLDAVVKYGVPRRMVRDAVRGYLTEILDAHEL